MPAVTDIADLAEIRESKSTSTSNDVERVAAQKRLIEAATADVVPDGTPLWDISFPLSMFDDGSTRVQFTSGKVIMPPDEDTNPYIRAEDIQLEIFNPDGSFSGGLIAKNGIFDRNVHIGYSAGLVRMQYKNFKVFGTNMVWDADTRYVKIFDGARVEMSGFMQNLGSVFKR